MTEIEIAVVRHLWLRVRLPPDSPDSSVKGFVHGMYDLAATADPQITDAQARWIDKLRYRYRNELPGPLRIYVQGIGGGGLRYRG